jgi:tRNA(Ile)-lysidine synthase
VSPLIEFLSLRLRPELAPGSRWCVAYSGGLDSTVLLHALHAVSKLSDGIILRAVHINHGWHVDAHQWAEHCAAVCHDLEIACQVQTLSGVEVGGEGREAAARRARYQVFEDSLMPDEVLFTAHHQDDQVETVMLRLLRGAGPKGIGSIAERGRFGGGWLVRPLLGFGRQDLERYARDAKLTWIDDPSNADTTLDRNYLRHTVLPALRRRWPGMGETLGRAARLSAEAAGLLEVLAESDRREIMPGDTVDVAMLGKLSADRQRNALRHILAGRGLSVPSESVLHTGLQQLTTAATDRQPLMSWPGGQIRRYRGHLYFLADDPQSATCSLPDEYAWDGRQALEMGAVRGRLRFERAAAGGLMLRETGEPMTVRFRRGGERIREPGHAHHKTLKKLFQAGGILPWMRGQMPLLYRGDNLMAVADRWFAAEALAGPGENGVRLVWDGHPEIE